MRILEYKLHAPLRDGSEQGMSTPPFVTNGGYFYNRTNHTMIAGEPDVTEYYIPDSVTVYTVAELKARQLAMHAETPFTKWTTEMEHEPGATESLTNAEVELSVDSWVETHS